MRICVFTTVAAAVDILENFLRRAELSVYHGAGQTLRGAAERTDDDGLLRRIEWMFALMLLTTSAVLGGDLAREWHHELAQAGYEGREDLLELLQFGEDKTLRYKASYLLSLEGEAVDAKAIEAVLVEPIWTELEKVSLVRHLSKLDAARGARAISRLFELLADPEARAQAMTMLAEFDLEPRYDELLEMVERAHWQARKAAIDALGALARSKLGKGLEPPPDDVLITISRSEEKWVRWQAVLNLNLLLEATDGDRRRRIAVALCERKLGDPSDDVRHRAKLALAAAGIECAVVEEK